MVVVAYQFWLYRTFSHKVTDKEYAFNYIGLTGNNRDEVTLIRRRTNQEVTF